jgi:hypothetical protein
LERPLQAIADRRNIAGLLGAAGGLLLMAGGIIDSGWLAITAGLYIAGFLGTHLIAPPPPVSLRSMPVSELSADLRRLARKLSPQLPPPAQEHLANILLAADAIEPKLREIDPANLSLNSVRQILADYIPTTLTTYTALPTRVRTTTKLNDGRTADAQLTDQLALLEREMNQAVENLSKGDLLALEVQGRFLEEKFSLPEVFSDR